MEDTLIHKWVFGYIRRETSKVSYEMPNEIVKMCFHFFGQTDYWDKAGNKCRTCNEMKTIEKFEIDDSFKYGGWGNTSYGWFPVDSITALIYKWHIEMTGPQCHLMIGITSNHLQSTSDFCDDKESANYSFYALTGEIGYKSYYRSYGGKGLEKGDVLCIVLDLKDKTLSYQVNGNDSFGVAHDNVEFGKYIQYKLAVSFCNRSQVTIKQFEVSK